MMKKYYIMSDVTGTMTEDTIPVSLVPCPDYTRDRIEKAVHEAVDLVGGCDCIPPGSRVLVKPNLLMGAAPDKQVCTHPEVLLAVCRMLTAAGCTVTVADSPGAGIPYTSKNLKRAYEQAGYTFLADEPGVRLNDDTSTQWVPNPEGKLIKQFEIITPAVEADAIVVVSKLKTHIFTHMTGGTKNLFGLIPGLEKPTFHARFHDHEEFTRMLIDLNICMNPVLQVMDAVDIMEGNGPMSGEPAHLGVILASKNYTAIDLVAAELIGFTAEVGTVREAVKLGIFDESRLQIRGANIEDLARPEIRKPDTHTGTSSRMKQLARSLLNRTGRAYALHPSVVREQCVKCGKCLRSCPTGAITFFDGYPHIARKHCISCFCCHEMCDSHAIEIRGGWLRRVVRIFVR